MSHTISGIVTSFEYQGKIPHRSLIGEFTFIPLDKHSEGFEGYAVWPFEEMTLPIQRLVKDLSFRGFCAYMEADYFGGVGFQAAVAWKGGEIVLGPLVSSESIAGMSDHRPVEVVANPINDVLKFMGIERDDENDEFDTAQLAGIRSNQEALK